MWGKWILSCETWIKWHNSIWQVSLSGSYKIWQFTFIWLIKGNILYFRIRPLHFANTSKSKIGVYMFLIRLINNTVTVSPLFPRQQRSDGVITIYARYYAADTVIKLEKAYIHSSSSSCFPLLIFLQLQRQLSLHYFLKLLSFPWKLFSILLKQILYPQIVFIAIQRLLWFCQLEINFSDFTDALFLFKCCLFSWLYSTWAGHVIEVN